jgi:hypothetical protein
MYTCTHDQVYCKKLKCRNCRDQPKYNQRVKAAGIDGEVAYKCASDYCDGSNCDWLRLYIDWHIVGSILISLDSISILINGGFDDNQFHLVMLGYQPQQSV